MTAPVPMAPRPSHVAIIQAHPDPVKRHYCHALADAYASGAREVAREVEVIEVAQLQFPLLRSREEIEGGPVPEDIQRVQDALRRSDHVVLIYPVWNGAMPALARGFLEQTFRPTFVFPDVPAGRRLGFTSYFSERKALSGRTARIVVTMQMPAFIYRWYFHPHPEKTTLKLSGLSPVRESLVGLADSSAARRQRWLLKMQALGRAGR